MSIVCPPKNDPKWKALVEAVGDNRAYVSFFRNGHQIPDIDTARSHLARRPPNYVPPAAAAAASPEAAPTAAAPQGSPEVPRVAAPPPPQEIPIERRPMQGKEAKERLAEINKALKAADKKEAALGPFKKNVRKSLAEERRTLLEERLLRQAELGSPEAQDAMVKHEEALQRHEALGDDEDAAVRTFVKLHPLATAAEFRRQGHPLSGEVEKMQNESMFPRRIRETIFQTRLRDRRGAPLPKGETQLDRYGYMLAEKLNLPDPEHAFTEGGILDRIQQAFNADERTPPMPPQIETKVQLAKGAPPRAEIIKPEPFEYGAVVQGEPSVDFRSMEGVEGHGPDEWVAEINRSLEAGKKLADGRGDHSGNRSETRVATALLGPDGKVHFAGTVRPQQTPRVGKVSRGIKEIAFQRMGSDKDGERTVNPGGKVPALARDVIEAGFKPLAVIHFHGDPAKIFKTFDSVSDFDEAWRLTEKSTGKNIELPEAKGPVIESARTEEANDAEIEQVGREWEGADPARQAELKERLDELYEEKRHILSRNQNQVGDQGLPFRTIEETEHLMPVAASRAHDFQAVMGRMLNQGGKVDLFYKAFYEQGATDVIQKQIDVLKAKLAQAKGAQKRILNEAIAYRQGRIKELGQSSAVTFSPWHIGVAMDNVQNATVVDLVKLLHEATEQASMHLSIPMRGRIIQAVDETVGELRAQAAAASERSGVPLARETGPLDLLSETLAQKLAGAGIPDHPTIIAQIVRWVKELYYRVAMAAQSAFGRDPDPKLALGWFENQMTRLVHGDYDQRLGRMLDNFLPEPNHSISSKFTGHAGTPGNIVDFMDPTDGSIHQPDVEPITSDALKWNIAFRTTGDSPGKELDIPDPEARGRIDAAALNHLADFIEEVRKEIAPTQDWGPFLKSVNWKGDDPKDLIAEQEARFKGAKAAKIGGERMTKDMDAWALWKARRMVQTLLHGGLRESSKAREMAEKLSDHLTDLAGETNKLESDVRNAAMHDDFLKLSMRDLAHELVRDYNRGIDTAQTHGDLARAVRDSENLLESDPIPERFQTVFKSIMDGGISIFGYMRELAKLDLDFGDMTNREVLKAIHDNAADTPLLEELSKNRPLAVALAVLARKNAVQMDQIQLGWLRNTEQFQAINADLKEIRSATTDKLRAMQAEVNERVKAKGLRERITRAYLQKRAELRGAQGRSERAIAKADLLDKAVPHLAKELEKLEIAGAGAQSEWAPNNGAEWTAMRQRDDGSWEKTTRVLRFNPDGSPTDPNGIRSALVANQDWLEENASRKGGRLYEEVKRQTNQLGAIDVFRKYHAAQVGIIDRWVQPIGDELKAHGGAGGRANEMVRRFDNILLQHAQAIHALSAVWSKALRGVEDASGIKDHGLFLKQVYEPVLYFLGTNPGLEEGPAVRKATALARKLLAKPPAEDFNERFGAFLRATKDINDRVVEIAQKEGAFVKDPRLKNDLRRAIARGWITSMRSIKGGVVSTVLREMNAAGWNVEMKEVRTPDGKVEKRMGKATTFDHLNADDLGQKNDAEIDKALRSYFTSGIKTRWLEPFINKGGEEILRWDGKPIFQQDLQDAWVESGGNVLKWIDGVAARQGIEPGEKFEPGEVDLENEGEEGESAPKDELATFRLSVLRQLNGLFGMESRMAADATQVRQIFDPMGPKPHVIMDARQNDLLPPEHLSFQTYDDVSARNLLGQIAFHGAFGRNGDRMVSALHELVSSLAAKHQDYQNLEGTTRSARVGEAAGRGWNYKELETAAKRYSSALELQRKLEGIFGVNNPAGPFNDMRTAMEVVHGMAGQLVDSPQVGFYHIVSGFERPFAMKSLGPATLGASAHFAKEFIKTGFGSLLETLNLHLYHASDEAKEVMATQGSAFRNLPYSTIVADIGARGRSQATFADRYLIRPIRMLRALQQKGVGGGASGREFPRFAGIPGMGILNWIMQVSSVANTTAQIRLMETLVSKGIRYFSSHREDYENPSFRFKPGDLMGKHDSGVFDYFRNKTVEYGMGNLEDIVRQAMPAAAKGERLVNKDQVIRLSQMASSELDGATSLSTTPSILQSNPLLKMGMPLLRWPLWKMHQAHEGLKNAEGRQNLLSTLKGLGTLAMWNLPVGLAMTFAMDKYNEDLLHKKSNLPATSPLAAIPFIGAPLDLLTSDKPFLQNLAGYAARMGKAGNIYGLGADLIGQLANPNDTNSGQRQFSLDQRVLIMSQFLNFKQAMENVIHQGGDTSWASVWKPFMQSLGGNGALQAVDLVNNALGLDNAESRLVSRINAQAWLRSAGQEAGMELRSSGGGAENPTQMGMWVREMQLAAMAGDRLGFLDAHRNALDAARKAVGDDPRVAAGAREREASQRVLNAWHARDPREVFRFKPTDAQLAAVLRNMSDNGQQDVRQALARYAQFTALISPTREERTLEREMTALNRNPYAVSPRKSNAGLLFASP